MSDNNKNIDEKVDELEAAKEKYLSENTVISIGGYAFTPAKLMIAATIVSAVLGGLYGAFEVYVFVIFVCLLAPLSDQL